MTEDADGGRKKRTRTEQARCVTPTAITRREFASLEHSDHDDRPKVAHAGATENGSAAFHNGGLGRSLRHSREASSALSSRAANRRSICIGSLVLEVRRRVDGPVIERLLDVSEPSCKSEIGGRRERVQSYAQAYRH
jgi:hypothetical protein